MSAMPAISERVRGERARWTAGGGRVKKSALTFVARGKLLCNGQRLLEIASGDCDASPSKQERACTARNLNAFTHKNFIAFVTLLGEILPHPTSL